VVIDICQWLGSGFDPFPHLTTLDGAEIKPCKHSDTRKNGVAGQLPYSHLSTWCVGGLAPFMINITHFRIKPLTLTNDHGRYITITPERTLVSVGECPLNI
jgi:hypothetical protein